MNEHGIKAQSFRTEGSQEENWRPPTELARSTQRPVTLTWRGILLSCVAVLLFGGGAFRDHGCTCSPSATTLSRSAWRWKAR